MSDNKKLALFIYTPFEQPIESKFIDGFYYPKFAYELPLWVTKLRDIDFKVCTPDLKTSISGYEEIYMSVMDVNLLKTVDLIKRHPKTKFILGGYVSKEIFREFPNVQWLDKLEEDSDYEIFNSVKCIPRLEMSYGCKYNCSFCSVIKDVYERDEISIINEAVNIYANLDYKYIYIGDKTFGQAKNYKTLELLNSIFSKNPQFKGFIIQTTTADLLKLDKQWLIDNKVKYIEIGLESYNDEILKKYQKPSTEDLINKAFDYLKDTDILFIPNVIVGFPEETQITYSKTLGYLTSRQDQISHLNIYNLAIYDNARKVNNLPNKEDNEDSNENSTIKSWGNNTWIFNQFTKLNEDLLKNQYGRLKD